MSLSTAADLAKNPELFFQSFNPTGSATILLIHGAFGSNEEWDQVVPSLTKADFHVLVPDLPTHARSLAIQPFRVDYAATLILELVDKHAKNGCAHIVGFSLGAHVAAYLAEHGKPEQILSVIASGYNYFKPPPIALSLITPALFCLHHLTTGLTNPMAEIRDIQEGRTSYEFIQGVMRTIFQPREIGDIHVRLLAIASASENTILAKDRQECSRTLFQAVVRGRDNGSRAVLNRSIRHAWHVQNPELFGALILAWVNQDPLDSGFEDIE